MKLTALIPTLNPGENLIKIAHTILESGFDSLVVINDGSDERCEPIFRELAAIPRCTTLRHVSNFGKGAALKTGFRHIIDSKLPCDGVVTLDDDAQHDIGDALKLGEALKNGTGPRIVLGVRDFDSPNVPKKSRFGNKITRLMLKATCGVSVTDSQTGLRAFSPEALPLMLDIPGERFEFETNMLIESKKRGISISEVPIKTIYNNNNKGTHFRPFRDSLLIYKELLKFFLSSGISYVIDISLFYIFTITLAIDSSQLLIYASTVLARVGSSLFNFTINRIIVFNSNTKLGKSFVKYYTLCVIQVILSALLTHALTLVITADNLLMLCKLIVDCCLFVISYRVQRTLIF